MRPRRRAFAGAATLVAGLVLAGAALWLMPARGSQAGGGATPCALVGDSLAVGLSRALPHCKVAARSGITSAEYLLVFPQRVAAPLVVISLGANDWRGDTRDNLRFLREGVTAVQVVWLVPNGRRPGVRDAILEVARLHGDRLLDTAPWVGADGLHPTGDGYRVIAARLPVMPGSR